MDLLLDDIDLNFCGNVSMHIGSCSKIVLIVPIF